MSALPYVRMTCLTIQVMVDGFLDQLEQVVLPFLQIYLANSYVIEPVPVVVPQ